MLRDNLQYEKPPHSKEEYDRFNSLVADVTGRTPNGEGWLKCEWGMEATRFYGGVEMPLVYDPEGKCWGIPLNLLLVWVSPDVYDRAEWAQLRFEGGSDVLGPFPHNGVRDLFRICYRENREYMPIGEEILGIARRWKNTNEKQGAKTRAVADYKAFNEERQNRRNAAHEQMQLEMRDELRREFEKPDLASAFSFNQSVRDAGVNDVPSGYTRTGSGIIAPRHAVAPQE